jgi:hypothetical protein
VIGETRKRHAEQFQEKSESVKDLRLFTAFLFGAATFMVSGLTCRILVPQFGKECFSTIRGTFGLVRSTPKVLEA